MFEKEGDRLLVSESDRVSRALGTKVFARVQATDGKYRLDRVEARSAFAPESILELEFEPTLPDLVAGVDTLFEGRFRVSLAGRSGFVSGRVRVTRADRDGATIQLLPEEPAWAVSRRITLALRGDARKLAVRVFIGE